MVMVVVHETRSRTLHHLQAWSQANQSFGRHSLADLGPPYLATNGSRVKAPLTSLE